MKKFLIFSSFMFLFVMCHSAPPVAEAPISGYGTPVTISVSSNTLTKVPTTQTSGRMGIVIRNPSTNLGNIAGHMGDCTSTAVASTVQPFLIVTSSSSAHQYISMREDVCLWLISLNFLTSAQNVHVQEVKQ